MGIEVICSSVLYSWWSVNGSFLIFNKKLDAKNLKSNSSNNGTSCDTKLTSNFKLWYAINLQLNPEAEMQERNLAEYFMDMSVQRKYLKDKANISVSIRDVFNTLVEKEEVFGEDFTRLVKDKEETRIFLLTMRYFF